MKILLFNENSRVVSDSQKAIHEQLSQELTSLGHSITSISTSDGKYSKCTGCWSCWLKTPGACAINDSQIPFLKEVIKSDLVIMFSPVRRGFISAQLKTCIDRLIPMSLPYFRVKDGQFSHILRYEKSPDLALLLEFETDKDKDNEVIISDWINRYCWHTDAQCRFVLDINSQPVPEVLKLLN